MYEGLTDYISGSMAVRSGLEAAVRATAHRGTLQLQAANGSASELHSLDYHDGLKYPHLQRDPSKPDLLQRIVEPQTARLPADAR